MSAQTPRSRFLGQALDYYETGDAQALFDLANDFWAETSAAEIEGLSEQDNSIFNRMLAELRESQADVLVNNRTRLGQRVHLDAEGIIMRHLGQMSADGRPIAQQVLFNALQRLRDTAASSEDTTGIGALDMRYSRELIELLPNIVVKAAALQELAPGDIPNKSVQRYFREAHSCYFYGLKRACAVLCRAILEASLKEVLGAKNTWYELIKLAGKPRRNGRPLLDDERIDAAERIHSAGNSAVHNEQRFDDLYPDTAVSELLLEMRKILEDVYAGSDGASA